MSSLTKNSHFGSIFSLGILIACTAVAGWLVQNRVYVVDQLSVWQYEPSSQVAEIAARTSLSESGTFYFYASSPSVEPGQSFNSVCKRPEKDSAILGCYSNRQIHIFDVTDARLDGIKEVTAAHEMLHAAWERLSDDERGKIEPVLEAAFNKVADTSLTDRMNYYARAEPGERLNELHSILGTEYSDLGPELESHYKKYFNNRGVVVSLHEKYNKIFIENEQKTNSLTAQLGTLGDTIESLSKSYNERITQLNADISSFNSRAESGAFASRDTFNAERSALVARSSQLEAVRSDINSKIASYEVLRKELEAVSAQSAELNRSLDSTLAPVPKV